MEITLYNWNTAQVQSISNIYITYIFWQLVLHDHDNEESL
jgi:hypothetical protein